MFHEMLDLKGLEKEVQKYRYKIEDAELFIPEDWILEDFTLEDLRRILGRVLKLKIGNIFNNYESIY